MKALFSGYYSPTEEEFKQLWSECLFVFDTNTLLNLYRYSKESRALLFTVMETISDRIWIPHQIALEYHKHMLVEIYNQKNEYNSISEKVAKFVASLQSELSDLRHSNIDVERINGFLKEFEYKIKSELRLQEESQPDLDLIKDKINDLLTDKIGPEYSQEYLNLIYEKGAKRYESKIPPGYKDNKEKETKVTYSNGLEYLDKYGDLIYWNQILDKSKEDIVKSVILITDDNKEDWVLTIKGQKKGPQPELVHEFRRESGNKLFYLYNTEQFLSHANKYFGINNDDIEKAIENVKSTKKYFLNTQHYTPKNMDQYLNEQNKHASIISKYLNNKINNTLSNVESLNMDNLFREKQLLYVYDVFAELQKGTKEIYKLSTFFARDVANVSGLEVYSVTTNRVNDDLITIKFYSNKFYDNDDLLRSLNELYSSRHDNHKFKLNIQRIGVEIEIIDVS